MTAATTALLIVGVVVAWVLFWCALLMVIARVGGWRKVAEAYPPDRALFEGPRFRWQSLTFYRFVGYNRGIHFTADRDGLLITIVSFFRPGHRPIFIPWGDIEVSHEKRFMFPVTVLRLKRCDVPITIARSLADQLLEGRRAGV